jgi:anti-sigma regulatory factor (Ser/Thr protein kinase)
MLEVRNSYRAIAPASAEAEAWLQRHQSSAQALNLALLAIEELVTNCIKYAYDDGGEHTIMIVLSVKDKKLAIDVIDDGRPFDPINAPVPETSLQVEDRSVGGLGLHLLRGLADHMVYERRDGTNRLTLTKRL